MKICYIGTFPPRECGIATFTDDLVNSMISPGKDAPVQGFIVAMNEDDKDYDYPDNVKFIIRHNNFSDYLKAADFINSHADMCSLQHEFNIFGGDDGVYILSLLKRLKIPVISTLHTIFKKPSVSQKYIIREISNLSQKVITMSHLGVDFLKSSYEIDEDKIKMIHHGVPQIQYKQQDSKRNLGLEKNRLIITFGLINRNKGIETVIKALPLIVKKHPDVRYHILGKTHPVIQKLVGEEYRNYLQGLVKKLNLEPFVKFENRFISNEKLNCYLSACDVCITPYLNEAQITSGPLSFAVGAGAAVISTPFWHAQELLSGGRGKLFDFKDSEELSDILLEFFNDPEKLNAQRKRAGNYGKRFIWPEIGNKYNSLFIYELKKIELAKGTLNKLSGVEIPKISFRHIKRMTDDTGILRNSQFSFPDYRYGYSLDDNARAVLAATMAKQSNTCLTTRLIDKYLAFIQYMQNPDGTFKNYLSYNRITKEEAGSEDCFGRTIWALGYLIKYSPRYEYLQAASNILKKAFPNFEKLITVRGISNTLIGLCYYLDVFRTDMLMEEKINNLTGKLIDCYKANKTKGLNWFEPKLTYDNAIPPLALLSASRYQQTDEAKKTGFESMKYLSEALFSKGHLSIIGNDTWLKNNGQRAEFDQQPVDAMGMVLLYKKAFELTNNTRYFNLMKKSLLWFLGENDLNISLYDPETHGCCDGLEPTGVNRNQGAESSLAFLISNIAYKEAETKYKKRASSKKKAYSKLPG